MIGMPRSQAKLGQGLVHSHWSIKGARSLDKVWRRVRKLQHIAHAWSLLVKEPTLLSGLEGIRHGELVPIDWVSESRLILD